MSLLDLRGRGRQATSYRWSGGLINHERINDIFLVIPTSPVSGIIVVASIHPSTAQECACVYEIGGGDGEGAAMTLKRSVHVRRA
jgi:hypothetical protein